MQVDLTSDVLATFNITPLFHLLHEPWYQLNTILLEYLYVFSVLMDYIDLIYESG